MITHRIGRAYAAGVGMTDQFMEDGWNLMLERLGFNEDQMITYMTGEVREDKGGGDSVVSLNDL